MSWQITVADDPDTTGVGTISAVWTEEDGTTFPCSERTTIDEAGQEAFIAKAITERDAWRQKKINDEAAQAALLDAINSADPEVQ